MADDERPDAGDASLAGWLEVEPLDDVTRRRLVSTALREADAARASAPAPARAWRWIAIAAAVIVVLAGGLALLTANGGHDEPQATRRTPAALAPEDLGHSIANAPDVGNFGDLDHDANLEALRAALTHPRAAAGEPKSADSAAGAAAQPSVPGCVRGAIGTIVAVGHGTIDGQPVTVTLLQGADGKQSIEALFDDSCEIRHISD
jgi:hypothetical protein